jgi:hypothetical protein
MPKTVGTIKRQVEYRPTAELVPYASNSRTHSEQQVAQIAASIREFGWTNPILIDERGTIIAGHGRLLAAQRLGEVSVPCITIEGLSDAQRRALIISDNQLALNAGWNAELLSSELAGLLEDNFDLSLLGFSEDELAGLLVDKTEGLTDPDDVPDAPAEPVTKLGDVWLLGKHRVMCGSSTSVSDVDKALAGAKIDLVCSDPPYGISVVKGAHIGGAKPFGKVGGGKPHPFAGRVHGVGKSGFKGRVHGPARNAIIAPGTYAPIIGDDTTDTAIEHYNLIAAMDVEAIVLWGGNYFANSLPPSRCWLVWDKENTGSFADAELAWTNQDKVVKVLRHQWSGLIKASERGQKRVHPTQKPVALAEWVIETIAPKCKVLFDGFLGSGWTLIAAEKTGIACVGLELSPAYVDVAVKRWCDFTGQDATLEGSGKKFLEDDNDQSVRELHVAV